LLDVRVSLNALAERTGSEATLTPFALVCRFLVEALRAHDILNATFVEAGPEIRVAAAVHLGIATSSERGLVVPVLRDAQRLTTLEFGTRIGDLVRRARAGSLSPSDLQGSTFTVSNFGALGLDDGVPVINYPEAAILGIGAIRERPCVVDGLVVACPTARLTCAFDHRVCDGADVGAFLSQLRALIEAPELALLQS
jgi:pyruvate dehydrogenase E2 component (dihydrolipoamide acetyltransferase)